MTFRATYIMATKMRDEIDEDLGRFGGGTSRPGFDRLLVATLGGSDMGPARCLVDDAGMARGFD